ncbi:hypothetical protein O7632_01010 [Solwaraspora sp. WMMD406]|uniref:hypothetical protein n=1 Tax=Solwaraspora sp. WMMD406 TaxID=3016095 RepID=UPI002417A45C|nr:hypothetical protein [Solwaraspora sp. WMMD406]MDG4762701.1 hypothetical protein [Solwaraspora sp. WMMD406]
MADGRLQGVVSSGSDIQRVYVSSIAAGTHELSCGTNNNRPCGGLHGAACNHITLLAAEAIVQYGADQVLRFLRLETDGEITYGHELIWLLDRSVTIAATSPAPAVFSRFLRHLSYLELPGSSDALPEMHWFPAGAVNR